MKQSGSPSRALLAGLVIFGAGALGYAAYRVNGFAKVGVSDTSSAQESPPPAKAGAAGEASGGEAKPAGKAIPDVLPEITLADKDGKPTRLASFVGKPLMVNFWATWCAPCRREIPLLNKIKTERKNVEIVGIAVDFRDKVLEFTKQTPLAYPYLIGEEDGMAAADALGVGMAFPSSIFVDSQGRILTVKLGELHDDEANFAFDRLADVDQGLLTREAAQKAVADAFREMAAERARQEAEKPASRAN